MSDEFIKVATKEINEEITSINKILKTCKTDSDVSKNSQTIEGHIHKIKGLAPMMGKPGIGTISALIDSLLNHMMEGKNIEGIFSTLIESADFMTDSMTGSEQKTYEIKQKIETKYSKYLD
jgi:chemotaxis protein histidine kinase CheA